MLYKGNKEAKTTAGSWNLGDVNFTEGAKIQNWSYLAVARNPSEIRGTKMTRDTVISFAAKLRATGVGISQTPAGTHINISTAHDEELERFVRNAAEKHQLLLVILPVYDTPLYNTVKLLGDVKFGIQTICVVASKFFKQQGQQHYFANVAMKFNLKFQGTNQMVDKQSLWLLNEGKTMVVGLDVTHPSPGSSSNAPSIAAMVASQDRWLAQFPGQLRLQTEARQEMVTDLEDMLRFFLKNWIKKHEEPPQNILVYRDGVSEGQYNIVLQEELPRFRMACKGLYDDREIEAGFPRITIIVVTKRHKVRMAPTQQADADRTSNAPSGVVVDSGITELRLFDFYLQAHSALQGHARSAHYIVIHDEIFRQRYGGKTEAQLGAGFKNVADVVQDLTHNMCYLQQRATKAVSVCPPAYYADRLCDRGRCYLPKYFEADNASNSGRKASDEDIKTHDNIKGTMFYL